MFILYDGPSKLDQKPIVLIATKNSKNPKTGDVIQTWILRKDKHPYEAVNSGEDYSICGDCPLRGIVENGVNKLRACYVRPEAAPSQVYKSYKNGKYRFISKSEYPRYFSCYKIRLGSYGDFAAIPIDITKALVSSGKGSLGYTHQWHNNPELAPFLMASIETSRDKKHAKKLGFRTFRMLKKQGHAGKDEIICPATPESSSFKRLQASNLPKITCERCGLCSGNSQGKKSIVVYAHGRGKNSLEKMSKVLQLA